MRTRRTRTGWFGRNRGLSYRDIRAKSMREMRIAEGTESQSHYATRHRPKEGQGSPISGGSEKFVPSSTGTAVEQRDVRDAKIRQARGRI
ncbi:hypothetical protein KI387_013522, partial [Taxus chinensis]